MQEYRSLALTILAIFLVTLIGAYFSPTFAEQKSYIELFMFFGALLFIFSVVAIFASLGFQAFALYMSLFLAVVIVMFGVMGAVIVTVFVTIIFGLIR